MEFGAGEFCMIFFFINFCYQLWLSWFLVFWMQIIMFIFRLFIRFRTIFTHQLLPFVLNNRVLMFDAEKIWRVYFAVFYHFKKVIKSDVVYKGILFRNYIIVNLLSLTQKIRIEQNRYKFFLKLSLWCVHFFLNNLNLLNNGTI